MWTELKNKITLNYREIVITTLLTGFFFMVTVSYYGGNFELSFGNEVFANVTVENKADGHAPAVNTSSILGLLQAKALTFIHVLMTAIPGVFVWLTGLFMNFTIDYLIVDMAKQINTESGLGYAIDTLWKMIRDIMNILFIFGLIYIGIKTILFAEDSSTRKLLARLIGAALLINFSLFITKVIVDFTNLLAVQIYNLIVVTGSTSTDNLAEWSTYGISGAFMEIMGVLSWSAASEHFSGGMSLTNGITYSFLTMVFLLIAGIVFAAGGFMVLTRFIALVLYMIFSPLMFAGWIFPAFQKYQSKWWNGFFKQAFFAPAYIFMLYLSLFVLERFRGGVTGSSADSGQPVDIMAGYFGSGGQFFMIMNFAFAAGMLIASVLVAQQMGIAGAGTAMGALNGVKSRVNSAKSAAYRGSVGRYYKGRLDRIDELNAQAASGDEKAAKRARRQLRVMQVSSGYATQADMRAATEKARNYGAGGMGIDAMEGAQRKATSKAARTNKVNEIVRKLETGGQDAVDSLKGASDAQLIDIAKKPKNRKLILDNAQSLSEKQISALEKSDDVNDDLVSAIKDKKRTSLQTNVTNLANSSTDDLNAMGIDYALKNAGQITEEQIDDWKGISKDEKNKLKEERTQQLTQEASTNSGVDAIFKRFKSKKERSKLPMSVLTKVQAVEHISTDLLEDVIKNQNTTLADRQRITMNFENTYDVNSQEYKDYKNWVETNNIGRRYKIYE